MKNNYTLIFTLISSLFINSLLYAQETLSDSDYGTVIQSYLNQKSTELNLQPTDIQDIVVNKEFYSKKTRITHVYINQRHQGVPIYNAISSVSIRDNFVYYYANRLISDIALKANTTSPTISSSQAIYAAASYFNLGSVQNLDLISSENNNYMFSGGGISENNIPAKLVYVLTEEGTLQLSWDVTIKTTDGFHWWSARIDATSGTVIDKNDWIVKCDFGSPEHASHLKKTIKKESTEATNLFKSKQTASLLTADGSSYNVFSLPVESPNHGTRQLVSEPSDDIASPFGWHDTDGISGADFTITRGNNVWAQEDRNGD